MTAGPARVDIVIVNWNGGQQVLESAASALDFGASVIVVDNGSRDGSAERLETMFGVTVHRMGGNAGFARACNAGVRLGRGEYVFLLNPDARLVRGSPAEVARAFAHDPRVRIVGPRIEDPTGRHVPSVRRLPTVTSLALFQLKLYPLARVIPPLRHYLMLGEELSGPTLVEQPMGAAFIMRRTDWDRLGGMDEAYFLWFEEVDLARRVADAGGTALYWPAIVVHHVGGTSFARLQPAERQRIWNRSVVRYADQHLGRTGAAVIRLTLPAATVLNRIAGGVRTLRRAGRRQVDGA